MTLLEVLIALGILAFMMLLTWRSIQTTVEAKKQVEVVQDREHEIRVAMGRMVADLEMAYISANENQTITDRRTLFIGTQSNGVDQLRFSSLAHMPLWADANESEQTMIAYYPESDQEQSRQTNLMRRESRRLSNENWQQEPAEIDVLLRDVEKVDFAYYDYRDKEWKERWDTTQADGERGRLPFYVRIVVEVSGPNGKPRKFTTTARLMMQEELRFFTN
jgi:type II secretory pathway component PulJ